MLHKVTSLTVTDHNNYEIAILKCRLQTLTARCTVDMQVNLASTFTGPVAHGFAKSLCFFDSGFESWQGHSYFCSMNAYANTRTQLLVIF